MKKETNIVLASSSNPRLNLLKQIKINPRFVFKPEIDEDSFDYLSFDKRVKKISYQKALKAKKKFKDSYIIAADTIIFRGKKNYKKTSSIKNVQSYLEELSGKKHYVYGGICVFAPDGKVSIKLVRTIVYFKKLSKQELNDKNLLKDGLNKAGGYAIQSHGSTIVSKLKGSYSNVVGLSLFDLILTLKGLGWHRT